MGLREVDAEIERQRSRAAGVPHRDTPRVARELRRAAARAEHDRERDNRHPERPPSAPPAPPPKAKARAHKLSKKEQIERRRARAERARENYLRGYRERLAAAQAADPRLQIPKPYMIPRDIWVQAWEVVGDNTGRAARIWLVRWGRRYPHAVGAIRKAALVPIGVKHVYRLTDLRARRIAALGMALLAMSARTRRSRRDSWTRLVMGVPRAALCALLADPTSGERPTVEALAGWPRIRAAEGRARPDATLVSGQCGYMIALKLAGFCYSQRLHRAHDALDACERGFPSGYAPARYWIVGRPVDMSRVRRQAELAELERLGWTDEPDDRASRAARAAALAELIGEPSGPPHPPD